MIGINNYINNKKSPEIDGHIHLFNKDEIFKCQSLFNKAIGFIDIEPKYIDDYTSCMQYYDNYIKNNYNKENTILLAASTDVNEMIEMHKKWPDIIKGFGEIKCYYEWKGKKLNLDKLSKYWPIFKYASENNLPIYIHFSLYDLNRVSRFNKLLKKYPNVKVVLCHCGMDEFTEDKDFAFYSVLNLMDNNSNLYTDISYVGLDYFVENPLKLLKFHPDRIILGSDLNDLALDKKDKIYNKINTISQYINNDINIKKIFNINENTNRTY